MAASKAGELVAPNSVTSHAGPPGCVGDAISVRRQAHPQRVHLLLGTAQQVVGVPRDRAAGAAVDVHVEDQVGQVHRTEVGRVAAAGEVVRLVEDQAARIIGLEGGG